MIMIFLTDVLTTLCPPPPHSRGLKRVAPLWWTRLSGVLAGVIHYRIISYRTGGEDGLHRLCGRCFFDNCTQVFLLGIVRWRSVQRRRLVFGASVFIFRRGVHGSPTGRCVGGNTRAVMGVARHDNHTIYNYDTSFRRPSPPSPSLSVPHPSRDVQVGPVVSIRFHLVAPVPNSGRLSIWRLFL